MPRHRATPSPRESPDIMSFLDLSPDLVSDLHDVFNMLYPPSPDSAVSDDEGDPVEGATLRGSRTGAAADIIDLDGPVNGLAPLNVREQRSQAPNNGNPLGTQGEKHSRKESLLDKLSRKRIRALLDTTLPLIGHAASTLDGRSTKKRKLIQLMDPDIEIPRGMQVNQTIPIWQRYLGNHGDAKRDRQRSMSTTDSTSTKSSTRYRPFSTVSYLSRLQTFTLSTYPTKPSPLISPQACAQAGWINHGGKDRLVCEVCHKAWRVQLPSKELTGGITLSTELKLKYIQLLAKQLVLAHTPSCPWRIRQCPPTIHQDLLLLNPPISSHLAPLAFDVETNVLARGETPSIAHFEEADIELVSPLETTQVDLLTENLNQALEFDLEPGPLATSGEETIDAKAMLPKRNHASSSSPISSTAAILAFFGWNVFRVQNPSPSFNSEHSATAGDSGMDNSVVVPDVLRCRICDRKLGIWSFRSNSQSQQRGRAKATPKALDVIREHREFCPIRTLVAGGADKDKIVRQSWWADAVILQKSLAAGGESNAVDRRVQLPASSADAQVPEKAREALENVVAELKDFTRVDIP